MRKFFDQPYTVFFPDFAMQRGVARNRTDLGVDHLDLDGHEGATG